MNKRVRMVLYLLFLIGVLQVLPPAHVPLAAAQCCSTCEANYSGCLGSCSDQACVDACTSAYECCSDGIGSGIPGCHGGPCDWQC